jgi:uncharacterized membrane protein
MMERVEKFIEVNAPVRTIFSFINEPFNLMRIWPGMIEVTDLSRLNNGGRNYRCVATLVGARILYITECIEFVTNQRIAYKLSGGLSGSIHWLFEAQNEATRVTLSLEYEIPRPLLKRHTQAAIIGANQHDIEKLLSNLKSVLERQSLVRE